MNKRTIQILKIILPIALLVAIDLLIKFQVRTHLEYGQMIELLGDKLMLTHVDNMGMAGFNVFKIGIWIFKGFTLILFILILRKNSLPIFMISSTLILLGWLGNSLDRLFFAKNTEGYMFMDYFYENIITHTITNISSLLTIAGCILLLFSIIAHFNAFKDIFRKNHI
ncbi:signal peptidase II [Cytophaga aurantiaca]|uniref:signal peptidase II n=1 Tax=Cytophaga aurantiaca TaxID=29530 RepID=UPI000377A826|nr:signal peptidase II [Cytophaga aurantiaca]